MHIRELVVVYGKRAYVEGPNVPAKIETPQDVAAAISSLLVSEPVEVGYVVCLNSRCGLIGYHEVSRGCLDSTMMHPREVFKAAILANAAGIVVAHNHPSGDPTPSHDDILLTARLKSAGQVLGIELFDHIIVGHHDRYYSFKQTGGL